MKSSASMRKMTAAALSLCCLLAGCGGGNSKAESSTAQTTVTTAATTAAKTTTTASETKKEEPNMKLEKTEDGWKGTLSCAKLGYDIELEAEAVSEDYVRRCAAVIENMSDELYTALCEASKRYCLEFLATEKDAQGDDFEITEEYQKVTADTPVKDIMEMVSFDTLYVNETEDESEVYFTLGGSCDWEPEHGIEAAIQGGTLKYLGGFESVSSPYYLSYYTEEEGRQWNYALTFEELTAGIMEKIGGIADLDSLEGVSEAEIAKAEQELGLMFAKEYRAILLKYGCISFNGHDWTGLGCEGEGNVIEETKQERELSDKFPAKLIVLENAGIDGIIIAANEFGDVFRFQNGESQKIHGSISEYLDRCLQDE